jgi:signal peptidase I
MTTGHFSPIAGPALSRRETALALAAEVLQRFGEVRIVEMGRSMIPAIYPGDVLTMAAAPPSSIQCGDVVLHRREGRFCVHRVTRAWQEANRCLFVTRGDSVAQEDPTFDETQLLGIVSAVIRRGVAVEFGDGRSLRTKLLSYFTQRSEIITTALLRWHLLQACLFHGASVVVPGRANEVPESR